MNINEAKICVFDLEATGTDVATDRIIQCAATLSKGGKPLAIFDQLIYPERIIPPEVVKLTSITNEMVQDKPPFKYHAQAISLLMQDADILAGFNLIRFDIPLLCEEFHRAGIDYRFLMEKPVYDAGSIFQIMEPRTLKAAFQFYCGKELVDGHQAQNDTAATTEVMTAQLQRYSLGNKSLEELDIVSRHNGKRTPDPAGKLMYDEQGRICFNTFRNRGVPVTDDWSYADWIMRQSFPESTKAVLREEYERIKNDHPF